MKTRKAKPENSHQSGKTTGGHRAESIPVPSVKYLIPRRDVWYAGLTEEERFEILSLSGKMSCDEAIKLIKQKFGKKISRASYYRAIDRLNANRVASTQLKAAATPPALDVLKDLSRTVRCIDSTLKEMLAKMR